jgi:hypothetical protein
LKTRNADCNLDGLVNIRFTSSLTPDDENVLAPALLTALTSILDMLPIAYAVRIETSDSQVFQHSGSCPEPLNADERARSAT